MKTAFSNHRLLLVLIFKNMPIRRIRINIHPTSSNFLTLCPFSIVRTTLCLYKLDEAIAYFLAREISTYRKMAATVQLVRPAEFPAAVPDDFYDFAPDPATDPPAPESAPKPRRRSRKDPLDRRWDSLYDLNLLAGRPATYAPREMGVLRTRWQLKFQRAGNGNWDYVEYVPPVSICLSSCPARLMRSILTRN